MCGTIKRFINVSTDEVYGETSLGKETGEAAAVCVCARRLWTGCNLDPPPTLASAWSSSVPPLRHARMALWEYTTRGVLRAVLRCFGAGLARCLHVRA